MKEKVRISLEQVLASKAVVDFVEAAREFCLLIETRHCDNPKEFLEILHGQLLTLYALGLKLPNIFIDHDKEFDTDVPDEQMRAIVKFISDRVAFSYYWTVLNPFDDVNAAEIGTGDLTDDLGDIYRDLKRTLMQFDNESLEAMGNAIWLFKFGFDNHWQAHCIDALQIIFHYLYENR